MLKRLRDKVEGCIYLKKPVGSLKQPRSWINTSKESFFWNAIGRKYHVWNSRVRRLPRHWAPLLTGPILKIFPIVNGKLEAERARLEVVGWELLRWISEYPTTITLWAGSAASFVFCWVRGILSSASSSWQPSTTIWSPGAIWASVSLTARAAIFSVCFAAWGPLGLLEQHYSRWLLPQQFSSSARPPSARSFSWQRFLASPVYLYQNKEKIKVNMYTKSRILVSKIKSSKRKKLPGWASVLSSSSIIRSSGSRTWTLSPCVIRRSSVINS